MGAVGVRVTDLSDGTVTVLDESWWMASEQMRLFPRRFGSLWGQLDLLSGAAL